MAPSPSIKIIPNDKLFVSEPNPYMFGNSANDEFNPKWTNENWLKSRFHFSFAEYRSRANSNFGVLRVMNDDLVQPHRGFGEHGHGDMEICTYVVEGKLTHEDSMGTSESLGRGSIQFMTAGSGVRHSEFNHGDEPLRFIQTWIVPSKHGLPPNYGSSCGPQTADAIESGKNKIHHLVSDVKNAEVETPVKISQDADAHAAELELGQSVKHELPEGRQAYLICLEGKIKINNQHELSRHDACEITQGGTLEIEAVDVEDTEHGKLAHFLMFSMKEVPGSGRTDL